jgi:hypothetical protein
MKVSITFEIDEDQLSGYADEYLAQLWHIAQANPAPMQDRRAGTIAERIGREIIRRWLKKTEPELWHHQGEHHYWYELTRVSEWNGEQWG